MTLSRLNRKSAPKTGGWFNTVNIIIMLLIVVATLYPFLNVLAIALNNSQDTVRGGVTIFPRVPTLDNFREIFNYGSIPQAFLTSVLRTVIGTILSVAACSMVAFTLNRKDFQGRAFLTRFLTITMFVSGGIIPTYLLMRDLNLLNTFLVYIIPGMVQAFNILMIRSYMDGIPYELQESAKMDGASDFMIFWRIILPVCSPVLATVALFVAVGQWNSWYDTYLYNSGTAELSTLQYELMKILQSSQASRDAAYGNDTSRQLQQVSPESIKMAITIITIVPILIVYPFLQRYFVRGMTLGSVKG